jgi:hypothetical protein
MNLTYKVISAACTAAILAGCAGMPSGDTKPEVAAPVVVVPKVEAPPAPSADQVALNEGIDLYNRGEFQAAIKRLGASEIGASGNKANQLAAFKYSAFSYCVTSRQTLCRQQFEKALKLDPKFDLAVGEHGHPLWGPVFLKAKKSK